MISTSLLLLSWRYVPCELSLDFWSDGVMALDFDESVYFLSLLRGEVRLIALHQRKHSLMPHHRHFLRKLLVLGLLILILIFFAFVFTLHPSLTEVIDQLVQHHRRQGVPLREQHLYEVAIAEFVLVCGHFHQGCCYI